jgi:hypothetical protein
MSKVFKLNNLNASFSNCFSKWSLLVAPVEPNLHTDE